MPARILVVEDNDANLMLVQYLLEHGGHEVLVARDGIEGLAVARGERPDLIVCDLQMPRLDGYGFLRELRADPHFCVVPVVAVTAFSMPSDRTRVAAAGFDGYLSKPIEPEAFIGQIESFLAPPSARTAS